MPSDMPQIRVHADLYRKISLVAASEERSVTNWINWTLRPIVERALGERLEEASGTEDGAAAGTAPPVRASDGVRRSAPPRTAGAAKGKRRRGRASSEYIGCAEHPDAGAVTSRGRHFCGEPGCPEMARLVEAS